MYDIAMHASITWCVSKAVFGVVALVVSLDPHTFTAHANFYLALSLTRARVHTHTCSCSPRQPAQHIHTHKCAVWVRANYMKLFCERSCEMKVLF